jgi:hypothetical protein
MSTMGEEEAERDWQRGAQHAQNDWRLIVDDAKLQVRHPADIGHRFRQYG